MIKIGKLLLFMIRMVLALTAVSMCIIGMTANTAERKKRKNNAVLTMKMTIGNNYDKSVWQ